MSKLTCHQRPLYSPSKMWSIFRILPLLLGLAVYVGGVSVFNEAPYTLSKDGSFDFQLLIGVGFVRYRGASVVDILSAAQAITPMSIPSYNSTFYQLAQQSQMIADASKDPISAQDSYFHAAFYYRNADFYLHTNWSDPHIESYWASQTYCFNKAIATLPVAGQRVTLPADGFDTIGIFYAPDNCSVKRPTILIGSGYDAAQEDSLHQHGFAFLERGWNVMTYEGPGQPTVRREQDLGFIYDWEKVATPAVDYLANRSDVDMSRLTILGISLGGYLAARAAAFEPRFKAVLLNDGVYSFFDGVTSQFRPALLALFNSGNQTLFDAIIREGVLYNISAPTATRWAIAQGLWSFKTESPYEWLTKTRKFTIANITQNIRAPVWVGNAVDDTELPGQGVKAAASIGSKATLHNFTGPLSLHCEVGGFEETNRVMFDWLKGVFADGTTA